MGLVLAVQDQFDPGYKESERHCGDHCLLGDVAVGATAESDSVVVKAIQPSGFAAQLAGFGFEAAGSLQFGFKEHCMLHGLSCVFF